ncbi:MAG: hypothetical protein ABIL27_06590 [candidate division WOR-3 bacterium]
MVDTLTTFLAANVTSFGTFKAFWSEGGKIYEDNNVFFNFVFLDAVYDFREKYPKIKALSDSILKWTLKYRPKGDMWVYWVDREIYPDFGDISLGSLVLEKYGFKPSPNVRDTIDKYRTKTCVFLFKAPYDVKNKRCDCIVNINAFRYLKDKSICEYLSRCWGKIDKLASYTYEYAGYFFYYFYSKALKGGLSCNFDIKERILSELKSDTLRGLPLILVFTSASILGIRDSLVDKAYEKISSTLMRDGGLPEYKYFYIYNPQGDNFYSFFGRTFPTIIFLEGVLHYVGGNN